MFQIKNFASITASMINRMKVIQNKITDFRIGGIARTMLEAVAQEIDELYQQMYFGLQQAIQTATYLTFNFSLLPSVAGSGLVTITITSQTTDVVIPAGTLFALTGGGTGYLSLSDVTISAGNTTANVLVAASIAGALGNIVAGSVFTVTPTPSGLITAINAAAFRNGREVETAGQRNIRFKAYIATLSKGTVAAIEYGLKTTSLIVAGVVTEIVVGAKVIEPYVLDNTQPPALIFAYIHNGVGSTSSGLVAQAQLVVNGYYDALGNPVIGWKAAGVVCTVAAATEVAQNVTGVITGAPGFLQADLVAQAESAIANYILGLPLGGDVLKAELIAIAMGIPGVMNFVMSAPTTDTAITDSQKAMPGTLAVT